MQNFHGQMHVLKAEIDRWKKGRFTVVFLGSDKNRVKKLHSVLEDYDIEAAVVEDQGKILPSTIQIIEGGFKYGF